MNGPPRSDAARRACQKLAVAACMLLLLAVADACWLAIGDDRDLFRVVAGGAAPASGDLLIPADSRSTDLHARALADGPAALDRHLRADLDSPDVTVHFLELQGRLWRAQVLAAPGTPPGEHRMTVRLAGQPRDEAPAYTVRVFIDLPDLRADQPSLFLRAMGVQPVWVVLGALPLALLAGALVYRLAGRELERLLAAGIAPIYRLARRGGEWEVVFGLGRAHGVRPGQRLAILDRDQRPVGQLVAETVDAQTATARVPLGENIGPGHFVARQDHGR